MGQKIGSQEQLFKKYLKFEVRSWKVRFDCENPNPGSVGSRFDFLEVRRFKVRNFPVRPKTSRYFIVTKRNQSLVLYLYITCDIYNMVLMNPKTMNLINMYAYFQRLISTSDAVT